MASPTASTVIAPTQRSAGRTLAQAVATGVSGTVAFVLGTFVLLVSSYGLMALIAVTAYASVALLAWLVGVALLALVMRRGPAVGFALVAVALAPIAALGEALLRSGPVLWQQFAAYPAMLIPVVWQGLGFTGAAAAGAVAGVVYRRARESREVTAPDGPVTVDVPTSAVEAPAHADSVSRRPVLAGVSIGLLVAGAALALALPGQWLSVYFQIWGDAPTATPGDGVRYLWTAGASIALLIAAVVTAGVRRGAGLIVLASVALACALIGAFVFQVPSGRFLPDPTPVYIDDGPVCFGTTGDCPGG